VFKGFLSGGRASLNEVALVIRDVSLTPSAIVIILKLPNVTSGVRVCHVALDADAFAISDMHSIGVIRSGEGINFLADQLHTICVIGCSNDPFTVGLSSSSSVATFSESLMPRTIAVTWVTFHSIPGRWTW
jgi:hypothetical protein